MSITFWGYFSPKTLRVKTKKNNSTIFIFACHHHVPFFLENFWKLKIATTHKKKFEIAENTVLGSIY